MHRHPSLRYVCRLGSPWRGGKGAGPAWRAQHPVCRFSPAARQHSAAGDEPAARRVDSLHRSPQGAVRAALRVCESPRPRQLRLRAGLGSGGARARRWNHSLCPAGAGRRGAQALAVREAEAALAGKPANRASYQAAAELAVAGARTYEHNAFKVAMGKETIVRTFMLAARNGEQA